MFPKRPYFSVFKHRDDDLWRVVIQEKPGRPGRYLKDRNGHQIWFKSRKAAEAAGRRECKSEVVG